MKLATVIPTLGRKAQLARLLRHLEAQTRPPDEVIVSAPDPSHVELPEPLSYPVTLVFGTTGSCAQRNAGLERALDRFDIISFIDDDFIPADDYFELVAQAFEDSPEFAVVMGQVIRDGATTAGLSWQEAKTALDDAGSLPGTQPRVVDHVGAYGCNMSVRTRTIEDVRFDERLALYGWQEDIDFSSRLRSRGRIVCVNTIRGVHLGIKTGRTSGKRFGYSQVANPIYLIRKGSVPATFALPLLARNLTTNVLRSLWPEPYVDRRGRLWGNLLALSHVLAGRIEPEHVLEM